MKAAPVCVARSRLQRGVAAVEFAFVFPVLFAIFYAIVSYGLIIATQQTLTLAAAEGARAALRYPASPSSVTDSINKRLATACSVARLQLGAFKGGLGTQGACATSGTAHGVYVSNAVCPYAGSGTAQCVTVTIRYDYTANQLVPNLPGGILPMPPSLQATAVVQINPEYVL